MHNQRSDIDRLRAALEAGGGGGLRGGKADARTLAESQRLTAELSKVQEQLERARTSAEENMLLRRELSKLASQILSVARAQGMNQVPQQQRMAVEVTQAYVEPTALNALQSPLAEQEPDTWLPGQAGNGAVHEPQAKQRRSNSMPWPKAWPAPGPKPPTNPPRRLRKQWKTTSRPRQKRRKALSPGASSLAAKPVARVNQAAAP